MRGARHVNGTSFWIGGDRSKLAEMATASIPPEGNGQFHALALYGYAGWAPQQLDGEVHVVLGPYTM